MQFKLVKVICKNIKLKNKEGKEFILNYFTLEAEGVRPIQIVPKDKEDYLLFENLCELRFSDAQPRIKDNSTDLLKPQKK